jgi:hypothetical protein
MFSLEILHAHLHPQTCRHECRLLGLSATPDLTGLKSRSRASAASLLLLHLHGLTLCCAAYYWTNKYYNPGTREKTTSKYSSKYQHHKLNLLSFTKERGWNKKSIIKKINVSFVLATCFLISLAHVIADAELFAQRRNSIPSLSHILARVQSVSRVVRFFRKK